MPGHAASFVPQFHVAGVGLCLHFRSRLQRHRIEVRQHLDAAHAIDRGKAGPGQVHSLFHQWQQMLSFHQHCGADTLISPFNPTLLILMTSLKKLQVQAVNIGGLGYRHPVIPPKVTDLAFHAALFMGFGGRAELAFKTPVRAECHESRCLFTVVSTQGLLHG